MCQAFAVSEWTIPRHYPSEGGLKHFSRPSIMIFPYNSEALSKWRRIETKTATFASMQAYIFRGIIQVKEDWNSQAITTSGSQNLIPRHYPSEGGLKRLTQRLLQYLLTYSEALSKWRRIETLISGSKMIHQYQHSEALSKWRRIETRSNDGIGKTPSTFRGIIQVKEDWNLVQMSYLFLEW